MAISKIKIGNTEHELQTTIDNVDGLRSTLAEKGQGIFYIEGSGTTDTTNKIATWLGSHSDIKSYYNGLTILYKVTTAGSTTTTLNINGFGAVNVVRNATTAISTACPVDGILLLTYTIDKADDGSTISYWKTADYDSNTKNSAGTSNKTGSKMYLVGATSQASSGTTTYTNKNVYIGTDDCLYSNGKQVATAEELSNAIAGVTLSSLGLTATATELNKLDGVTATTAELNYTDGVTSNIQSQLDSKAHKSHTHTYDFADIEATNAPWDLISGDNLEDMLLSVDSQIGTLINDKANQQHSHTIKVNAVDDDVVVLSGTGNANEVTYNASHANSGVTAGTYKSVTVNTKGHVTSGSNPTTLAGYGITDALTSSTKYAGSSSVGGAANSSNIVNITRPSKSILEVAGDMAVFTEAIYFFGSDGAQYGAPVNYVIINAKKGANHRTILDCYALQTGDHYINGCMNAQTGSTQSGANEWTGWVLQPNQTSLDTTLDSAKSYTDIKVANLINGAPSTLDTLKEIADAMQNNPNIIATLESAVGNKVDKVSGKGLSANDYTTTEKTKLAGVEAGAQVNQNAFSWITVGTDEFKAPYSESSIEIFSGDGISVAMTHEYADADITISNTGVIGLKGNAESTYRNGTVNITPANIGLGNVNNTSDADKPVSTAQRQAIDSAVGSIRNYGKIRLQNNMSTYAGAPTDGPGDSYAYELFPSTKSDTLTIRPMNNLISFEAIESSSSTSDEIQVTINADPIGSADAALEDAKSYVNQKETSINNKITTLTDQLSEKIAADVKETITLYTVKITGNVLAEWVVLNGDAFAQTLDTGTVSIFLTNSYMSINGTSVGIENYVSGLGTNTINISIPKVTGDIVIDIRIGSGNGTRDPEPEE